MDPALQTALTYLVYAILGLVGLWVCIWVISLIFVGRAVRKTKKSVDRAFDNFSKDFEDHRESIRGKRF